MVHAVQIMDGAHEITKHVLHFGVDRSFAIARCHYENIDLPMMSQGFVPNYTKAKLEEIAKMVAPWSRI